MKAIAKIKNLNSESCKKTIIRNLGRLLDIRIIDIDIQNGTILFLYTNPISFRQVKRELRRIGYPIREVKCIQQQEPRFQTELVSMVS